MVLAWTSQSAGSRYCLSGSDMAAYLGLESILSMSKSKKHSKGEICVYRTSLP